ncbi:MAG: hypothetical protein ACXVJD_09975 [Mucilaginibacter sp.]
MFKTLDIKTAGELFLVKRGWWSPEYDLTDDAFVYGTLAYRGLSKYKAIAKTKDTVWAFRSAGPFSRIVTISDQDGVVIGTASRGWFSRLIELALQNGFRAEFYKASIWSRDYIWGSGDGQTVQITSSVFRPKDTVNIANNATPVAAIPLLIFLGKHLIILRRRRKAAH